MENFYVLGWGRYHAASFQMIDIQSRLNIRKDPSLVLNMFVRRLHAHMICVVIRRVSQERIDPATPNKKLPNNGRDAAKLVLCFAFLFLGISE